MDHENQTGLMYFTLLGLSERPELQTALCILFLSMYLVAVVSNGVILIAIYTNPVLHTTMYFFIGNLSLVDICLTTTTVPQLLTNIILQSKAISLSHCFLQLYFFLVLEGTDSVLLGAMAFDRYIAICNPLRYSIVMNKKACNQLAAGSCIFAQFNALLHTLMITRLTFCKSREVQNFFCDIPPLLKLSCSDTSVNELLILTEAVFMGLISILTIVISYTRIILAILQISSSNGRRKTFSTCSSHLIVVSLYYGTILFTYIRPRSSYSLEKDKVVTVIFTIVTPMLNPFNYSLRNNQFKCTLKKAIGRHYKSNV